MADKSSIEQNKPPSTQRPYDVFISWSGNRSKLIAHATKTWLTSVIQTAEPFVSDKDIAAGARGLEVIEDQLDRIRVGILCLTQENLQSTWMHFEAGALSKQIKEPSFVIPLLFDIERSSVEPPLSTFQSKFMNSEDMVSVAQTVNHALGHSVPESRLLHVQGLAFDHFMKEIEKIRQLNPPSEPRQRPTEEIMEELVQQVRDQSVKIDSLESSIGRNNVHELQGGLVGKALNQLSEIYDRKTRFTVESLASMGESLDSDAWKIIETAPYLKWYLEHYHGLVARNIVAQSNSDMDDVPF